MSLLRSRWAVVARAHIQHQLNRRFLSSTAQTRYGATLSFRRSHSFIDPDTTKPNREFPINIIDGEDSIRRYTKFIEEGELDEARKIMVDFVSLHPAGGNMDLFRQLKSIVLTQPDISLLLELGGLLASKGHLHFVREEIRPVIADLRSDSMLAQFDALLAEIERRLPGRATGVFEETSEDYATVLEKSAPRKMDGLLKLPTMLRKPREGDTAIFEDEGADYAACTPTISQEASASQVLLDLLARDSYDRAFELLREMMLVGTAIEPSRVFEGVAVRVLSNSELTPSDKAYHFLSWLSLVPPYRRTETRTVGTRHNFLQSRHALLQSTAVDPSLLKRCLVLMASLGYHRMSGAFLPPIIRYSSIEGVVNILNRFERAIHKFWLGYEPEKAEDMAHRAARDVRGIAVRVLTYSGRLKDAVSLLPTADEKHIYLTLRTYNILLDQLQKSTWVEKEALIRLVQACIESGAVSQDIDSKVSTTVKPSTSTVLAPPDDPNNLPLMLRYLSRALLLDPEQLDPLAIADFMQAYVNVTGRTRGFKLLLNKSLRGAPSFLGLRALVTGEMHYYRRKKRPDLVIKAFVEHFYMNGVPREELRNRYDQYLSLAERYQSRDGYNPHHRATGFHPGWLLPRGRLWPEGEQTALVWGALVYTAQSDAERMRLYERLLDRARRGLDQGSSPDLAGVEPLQQPSRRRTNVSAAAFMPFLRRLPHAEGPEFAARLLEDMHSLALPPTAYHYSETIQHWSRGGYHALVFALLDHLESDGGHGLIRTFEEPWLTRTDDGQLEKKSFQRWSRIAKPDTRVYISALRGFIYSGHVNYAEEVLRRMQIAIPTPPGSDEHLDRAIEDLERFKSNVSRWASKNNADQM